MSTTTKSRDPVIRSAVFSDDRMYRYALVRDWDFGRPCVVIGLNPSTADETNDDPTIRRCIAFAKREGCSKLVMLNLFAYRATNPEDMKDSCEAGIEIVGPSNDAVIAANVATPGALVIAAWGVHGTYCDRDKAVAALVPDLLCFGVTKDGHPRHPLYLPSDASLIPYPPVAVAETPAHG